LFLIDWVSEALGMGYQRYPYGIQDKCIESALGDRYYILYRIKKKLLNSLVLVLVFALFFFFTLCNMVLWDGGEGQENG